MLCPYQERCDNNCYQAHPKKQKDYVNIDKIEKAFRYSVSSRSILASSSDQTLTPILGHEYDNLDTYIFAVIQYGVPNLMTENILICYSSMLLPSF